MEVNKISTFCYVFINGNGKFHVCCDIELGTPCSLGNVILSVPGENKLVQNAQCHQ